MQSDQTLSETSRHIIMKTEEKNSNSTPDIKATAPGQIRIIRRNGKVVPYDGNKINIALTKAFLAQEGKQAPASNRIHDIVSQLTDQITQAFERRMPSGGTLHIEDIQDQVELALMRSGEHKIARAYVLYREERNKLREIELQATGKDKSVMHITLDDGLRVPLDLKRLANTVAEACINLTEVSPEAIIKDVRRNVFDGISIHDLNKALILSARTLIESEPNHSYVAARLLLNELSNEALNFLQLPEQSSLKDMGKYYATYFASFIDRGIELNRLDKNLKSFDLKKLGKALLPERDLQFTYLGLQTLYDRYFIHCEQTRYEMPQAFFMRVAMGLAANEENKNERAIEFYQLLSSFDFMSSTPTLFNSGTIRPQLSSCYLSTIPDSLDDIYNAIKDNALLSKFAGGLGNDWTPVRANGSHIHGTNGQSLGPIPFMVVANATLVAVNQGGKRKGAGCAYLETFHKCIEAFLDLRKNTGDERRRTHDMNTANWIPDLFMKRVYENGDWTLFSPDDTPELHETYGKQFEEIYTAYEAKARSGEIKNTSTMSAVALWRKMLGLLFETGHPWVTFKDPCNLRSPQQHVGVVHSSNLCTEITLNTSADEIAVCNLGSVNLPQHVKENGELDHEKLEKTITTAIRMLDNVIDINYYSVPQARRSNLRHRPIGMGIMGFQDALYKIKVEYASDAAVEFADRSMELISYYAIKASTILAEQRGAYDTFEGSLWSKGILPIDSIELLEQARGKQYLEMDRGQTLDWKTLRERVKTVGMRNSNVMAIAPTATISNIVGTTQSIEPTYQNLYVKSNLSGEFTVVNPYLYKELKALDLWDDVMVNDLKYYNGSLQAIDRIPENLKSLFATAFEIDSHWLIDAASRRQKWLDQAQSLNLYMAKASGKKLDKMYRLAWIRGLKTTYYLRSMGATNAEKATISDRALNAVQVEAPQACSIEDPDCEACQ